MAAEADLSVDCRGETCPIPLVEFRFFTFWGLLRLRRRAAKEAAITLFI